MVFRINLIPFFDICSVHAVLAPGLIEYVQLYLGHCAVATVAVCGFATWALVFHCGMPRQISPLPPTPSWQTEVCSTMGESIRPSSLRNPTPSAKKHVVQICRSSLSAGADGLADGSGERRTSPVNGIERSLSRAVQSQRLCPSPLHEPRFQQRCICTLRRDACERISAIQAVLKCRTGAIRKELNTKLKR